MVGVIALGTHDGCWRRFFLSFLPERGKRPSDSHSFSVGSRRGSTGGDSPTVAPHSTVVVAGGSGDAGGVVVGFPGTSGAGHEAPNASVSGQIRPRSPEISWSFGGCRDVLIRHGQSVLALLALAT